MAGARADRHRYQMAASDTAVIQARPGSGTGGTTGRNRVKELRHRFGAHCDSCILNLDRHFVVHRPFRTPIRNIASKVMHTCQPELSPR